MKSLLNRARPPLFCPGCSHELVVHSLDRAFQDLQLAGEKVAIVSDIGCSGLFDTFFNTHALHGLHGRALTYAAGLKMSRPELKVVVVMGDGGLGIGGAHVLSSCRRNLDITLLVLNNFNYGMTGGQCSATTPGEAVTASGFLNRLEIPLDICGVAAAAGAPYVDRCTAADKDLDDRIGWALTYHGFSLLDIWGICPGRYTKRNRVTFRQLEEAIARQGLMRGEVEVNRREEYGVHYRRLAAEAEPPAKIRHIEVNWRAPVSERSEVLILGAAGQYINTVGEILSVAAMSGGLHATQKNDYPITVLRGYSVSEVVLDCSPVDYTGITRPSVIIAVAEEGIERRAPVFGRLGEEVLIVKGTDLALPPTRARILDVDFSALKIARSKRGLAALAILAGEGVLLNKEMLLYGLTQRYAGKVLREAVTLVNRLMQSAPTGRQG
ncbi:MAG: thiamine pyrophosphate-dependent enzyme [Desulforhopalus sp.]